MSFCIISCVCFIFVHAAYVRIKLMMMMMMMTTISPTRQTDNGQTDTTLIH